MEVRRSNTEPTGRRKLQKSLSARSNSFKMLFFNTKKRPTISYPLERLPGPVIISSTANGHIHHNRTSISTASVLSRHSSRPSDASGSTAPTSIFPSIDENRSVEECSDQACTRYSEDWLARFRDDVDVSDDCPNQETLDEAGEIPVYDQDGNSRQFRSFYSGDNAIGQRQLILFVRHFYCGACQAYLKALSRAITPRTYFTMPTPTSIVIIGCGKPSLIPFYRKITGTPFPIFADPTRKLYKALGMSLSLNIGPTRPEYMNDISPPAWLAGQIKEARKIKGKDKLRGGNPLQIGGEFLLEEGEVIWCHRMRNYRNHTEVDRLKRVLEVDDD